MGFIFGIVVGICLAALIGHCWQEDGCDHTWKVTAAHQMMLVHTIHGVTIGEPDDGQPVTEVLSRCTVCGETVTEELSGHWTYEQLSGEPDASGENTTFWRTAKKPEPEQTDIFWRTAKKPEPEQTDDRSGTGSDALAGGDNPDAAKSDSGN
jgi:hypothetical protein